MNHTISSPHATNGQQRYIGANDPANTTARPPQPYPQGKNGRPGGHKQGLSVTSNPSQESAHTPSQPGQPNAGSQPAGTESDFMSSTFSFGHAVDDSSPQNFSFDDLMTPEYSDNHISEHTTPQEFIWEQQFIPQDATHPQILGSQSDELNSPNNTHSPPAELRSAFPALEQHPPKYVSGAQLLSPQLSTSSTPAPAAPRSPQQAITEAQMSPWRTKRPESASGPSTSKPALTTEALNQSQRAINQMPVSPVVIVSSHNRGDSPARTAFPRLGKSSKRGRESGLHDASGEEEDHLSNHSPNLGSSDGSHSRLMPPDPFESDAYADHGDDDRAGLGPSQRGNEQVASVNDLAEKRKIDEKNAEVADWLAKSETGSATGDDTRETKSRRARRKSDRPRAHSTGVKLDAMGLPVYSDKGLPGPGVLVDENSEDGFSDDSVSLASSEASNPIPESPPVSKANLKEPASEMSDFPPFEAEGIPPELQEPLPRQFYRRSPWQDPVKGPIVGTSDQPNSSNAAAWRFNEEAAKWESASRAATWGTRRRLSESEVSSIVDGSRVRHLSLAKRGRERGSSILSKARGLIPRRSNSNIKKGGEHPAPEKVTSQGDAPQHRDSASSVKPVQRMPSYGKPKSPPLNTGSAIMAMTGNLAAVGHSGSFTTEPEQKSEGLRSPLQVLRKHRSKSDVAKSNSKSTPGLAALMRDYGGPPMPTLASPMQEPQGIFKREISNDGGFDDDDDDEMVDEVGIKMDLSIRAEQIIPNYDGFKTHARQLNPRLEPYLIDRIGQEQVRRYKKLIENKVKHARAVIVQKKCASGQHCFALGGDGTLLPPRVSAKDPESTCAQFQISNPAEGEVDDGAFEEGIVTPALFPPGIPLPPVKRLPAEFECSLCFKVKKFQKPSDWTKHVHEDVQPFSCTFPNCNEPKSFKRKADWVRHENERHRRLEYWKCNVQECNHVCYRKDNFVQHLVREHKKTEPKIKGRGSGSSKSKPVQQSAWQEAQDNEVWQLVDCCRHETLNKPRDEPCKFCGNVCNSWKKLSVHMGKHMEQIAMPVLELVNLREVTPDTVLSPIEQNYGQNTANHNVPNMFNGMDPGALSPYAVSNHSTYHSSSAGHSPATLQAHPQINHYSYDQGYYSHGLNTPVQGHLTQGEAFGQGAAYSTNATFDANGMPASNSQFASINTQLSPYPAALQTPVSAHSLRSSVPRSQPGDGYHSAQMAYGSPEVNQAYQQYTPTSATTPFPSESTHPLNANQHYNLGTHSAAANEYSYGVQQMNDGGPPYHRYP